MQPQAKVITNREQPWKQSLQKPTITQGWRTVRGSLHRRTRRWSTTGKLRDREDGSRGHRGKESTWLNSVESLSVHLSLHHPQGSRKGFSQMSRVYLGLDDLNCSLRGKHKILFGELWRQLKLKPDFSIWWDI